MDDLTLARAVHVLAVIHWIGGVAFVTAVILPVLAVFDEPSRRLALFEVIEHRFSAQVKVSVPLAGFSGAYMAWRVDSWSQFLEPARWWLAAMVLVWALFMALIWLVVGWTVLTLLLTVIFGGMVAALTRSSALDAETVGAAVQVVPPLVV